jgi:hypothetical protein
MIQSPCRLSVVSPLEAVNPQPYFARISPFRLNPDRFRISYIENIARRTLPTPVRASTFDDGGPSRTVIRVRKAFYLQEIIVEASGLETANCPTGNGAESRRNQTREGFLLTTLSIVDFILLNIMDLDIEQLGILFKLRGLMNTFAERAAI